MKRSLLVATLLALLCAGALASTPLAAQAATRSPSPTARCLVIKLVLHGRQTPQATCLRSQPPTGKAPAIGQDSVFAGDLVVYQDAWYGGGQLCFSGQGSVNLTDFLRVSWCWFCGSWNDQISSFQTGMTYGRFFWDTNNGGAHYSFFSHENVPWIGSTWNDQISAITIDGPDW